MKIALFGKMRSGKDTVGEILIKEHGFNRFAFGDGIGNIIKEYFPEALEGGKPREHYQHIGQELRALNPDVWINYLLKNASHYIEKEELFNKQRKEPKEINVVVTDGRQLNEATRLKEEGYIIVKVTTPEELRIQRMEALGDKFSPEQLNHETELQVDLIKPDIEIFNDKDLETLKNRVQGVLYLYELGAFEC